MITYSGYTISNDLPEVDYMKRLHAMSSLIQEEIPSVPRPKATRSGSASREDMITQAREFDHRVSNFAAKGDENIIGYVWGVESKLNEMVNLAQIDLVGNFDKIQGMYDELRTVSSSHQGSLSELSTIGDRGGQISQSVAVDAKNFARGDYNTRQVKLSDGTTTTLGQLFGGDGFVANTTRKMTDEGFSRDVVNLYMGEDRDAGRIMKIFVDAARPRDGQVDSSNQSGLMASRQGEYLKDSAAIIHAANHVADMGRYKNLIQTLGTRGASALVRDTIKNYRDPGGMTYVMDGVVDYFQKKYKGYAPGENETPPEREREVVELMSAINDLYVSSFSTPGEPPGNADPVTTNSNRRLFMSGILATLKRLPEGTDIDFRSPEVRTAMKNAMAVHARAKSAGYNLFDDTKRAGENPSDGIADYIIKVSKGDSASSLNPLSRIDEARHVIDNWIEVSPPVSELQFTATGDPGMFLNKPASVTGKKLATTSAEYLHKSISDTFERYLAPYIISGTRTDDALRSIVLDDTQKSKILRDLTDAVRRHGGVTGRGGAILAESVAAQMLNSLVTAGATSKFSITGMMHDIILDDKYIKNLNPEDRTAVRNAATRWYLREVAEPHRFTRERARIVQHLKGKFGGSLDSPTAQAQASAAIERAQAALESGNRVLAAQILRDAATLGLVYKRKLDKDEKPVMMELDDGVIYEVERAPGRIEYTPEELAEQARLEQEYIQYRDVLEKVIDAQVKEKYDDS